MTPGWPLPASLDCQAFFSTPHAASRLAALAAKVIPLLVQAHAQQKPAGAAPPPDTKPPEYVGSATCQACHEDIFNGFRGILTTSWRQIGTRLGRQGVRGLPRAGEQIRRIHARGRYPEPRQDQAS